MRNLTVPLIHPGEQLREEFVKPLGLTVERLATDIGVPINHVQALMAEKREVNVEMAMRLARYFGTSPKFWLDLQRDYDLSLAELNSGPQIAARVRPYSN